MKWLVDVEGEQYLVEARYGKVITTGAGEVLVNNQVVKASGSSVWGLPKEISFEIAGRPALLRRRGIVNQKFDLIFGGKLVKRLSG